MSYNVFAPWRLKKARDVPHARNIVVTPTTCGDSLVGRGSDSARILRALGAVDAVNLDGGGSTTITPGST